MDKIVGVVQTPLKKFSDDRGAVLKFVSLESTNFDRFGEVYFSTAYPGVIKGWKRHLEMTQLYTVPQGVMKVVIFDARKDSTTFGQIDEYTLSREDHCSLKIPPGLIYAFTPVGDQEAIICNFTDIPHQDGETVNYPLVNQVVPHKWAEGV